MVIIFLILNEFSCDKVEKTLYLFAGTKYLSVSKFELVWKNTLYVKTTPIQ